MITIIKNISIILILLLVDQLTKVYFINYFHQESVNYVNIFPFLNFVYVKNTGISFGLFNGYEYSHIIFTTINIIISSVIFYLIFFKKNSKLDKISFILIFSGAIGNIVDRIRLGYVYDFIDIYIGSYHWPAFNIADSLVVIGAIILLISNFKKDN